MEHLADQRVVFFDVDCTLLWGDCLWLAARRSKGLAGQLLAATPATLLIRLMTLWFAPALGVGCLLWQPRRKL